MFNKYCMVRKQKKLFLLLFAPISLIIILLLLHSNISFDFIAYKTTHINIYRAVIIFGFIALPLILILLANKDFRLQKTHSKLLILGISLFVVSLNFNLHFNYIFTIVFGVCILIDFVFGRKFYKPDTLHILFFIYATINALSLFWTNDLKSGFYWLKLQMAFIYFPLAFCLFRPDRKQFDITLISIFRWMIVFAVLSVGSWILQSRALGIPLSEAFVMQKHMFLGIYQPFDIVFAWSNFYHPTFISITLMLGLSIGWYYTLRNKVTGYELAFYIVIVLLMAILTQSRFMIVAWLLVNILFVVYMLQIKPKLQRVVIVIITLIAVFALAFYPDKIKNFFSDTVRIAHYKAAFEAIEDNQFWGTGLGGMTKYINENNTIYQHIKDAHIISVIGNIPKNEQELSTLIKGISLDFIGSNPHNQFVGDLMQTGILGLLSILSIIIYVLYLCVRQKNQLLFCFFSIFFLLMLIEMPLMVENGIMCFTFILCLLIGYNPDWEKDTKH